jgi:hypothetical protein
MVLSRLAKIFQALNAGQMPALDFSVTYQLQADTPFITLVGKGSNQPVKCYVSQTRDGVRVEQDITQITLRQVFVFTGKSECNTKALTSFLETVPSQAANSTSIVLLDGIDRGLSDMVRREVAQTVEKYLGSQNCHVLLSTQSSVIALEFR